MLNTFKQQRHCRHHIPQWWWLREPTRLPHGLLEQGCEETWAHFARLQHGQCVPGTRRCARKPHRECYHPSGNNTQSLTWQPRANMHIQLATNPRCRQPGSSHFKLFAVHSPKTGCESFPLMKLWALLSVSPCPEKSTISVRTLSKWGYLYSRPWCDVEGTRHSNLQLPFL